MTLKCRSCSSSGRIREDGKNVSSKAHKWLTGSWSPLFRIIDCAGKRWLDMFVPDSPGLYRLVALDASMPGIVPASLNRICAVDSTGTLYIGATSSLRRRLATLILKYRTNGPLAGGSGGYRPMSPSLAQQFAPQSLAVAWQSLVSDERNQEQDLLQSYKATFGELPPMSRGSGI